MTYLHPCNTFTVTPYGRAHLSYTTWCSCGWSAGGWTTRALALAALGRHLEATADA